MRALPVAAALVLAGCGSTPPEELPPAAEPARSPPAERPPAGRVVEVGNKPEGLAADPRTGLVAVGLSEPGRLALVDARSGRVVRRVPLPAGPRHLQLAEPGGPVLVPAEGADRLVQVALPDGEATSTGTGDGPHDAAAAPGSVFVADEFASTVSVIERGRRVQVLDAPLQPGGVAVSAGTLALVAVRERVLRLYDARRGRVLGDEAAGVGPTHVVAGEGGRLFVVDTDGGALLLFRTEPELELVRRVALPGKPYGIAHDPRRDRLWVTLTARNELVEVTENGLPRPLRRFPAVRQPNSVAVEPRTGRVFVASRSDGTLQLLDP